MLYFLHLPKTAGTTLAAMLRRVYGSPSIFFTYDAGGTHRQISEAYAQISHSERTRIRVIAGHFYHGIDRHIDASGSADYFTFFRDPVERVVSYYYYVQRTPKHYRYSQIAGKSLRDVVSMEDSLELDNALCRIFAPGLHRPFGQCDSEVLDLAKANLSTFRSIGLADDFNRSVVLLGHQLGWKRIPLYERLNTADRPVMNDIDSRDLDFLRERLQPDIELYNYAVNLYRRNVSQAGPQLDARFVTYQSQLLKLSTYSQQERDRILVEPERVFCFTGRPARVINKIRAQIRTRPRNTSLLTRLKPTA